MLMFFTFVVAALSSATALQDMPVQTIKHVDLYGLRTVSEAAFLEALDLRPGDDAGVDRDVIRERLLALDGIADAILIQMYIPGDEIMLVGVSEDRAPVLTFHSAPTEDLRLPEGMVAAYEAALERGFEGMMKGTSGETIEEGHSFSTYGPALEQDRILFALARDHVEEVRAVLLSSRHDLERTAAAKALSFFEDKSLVVGDLARAIEDPSESVRNNGIRALSVLASWINTERLGGRETLDLVLDTRPLIVLLESLEWTDRNKAAALLSSLSMSRDAELFGQLRESSIPALREMALWHSRAHALYSVRILGRMAGLGEDELHEQDRQARLHGDRAHRAWVDGLAARAAVEPAG
jgi:hypothetical protein